jgi:hypothetical protein
MPYKRGYKKRPSKKDPVVRRSDLQKALRAAPEMKMVSIRGSASIDAELSQPNQFVRLMNNISVGQGINNRIGDEITAQKLVIRGTIGLTYSDLELDPNNQPLPALTDEEFCQRFRIAIIKSKIINSDAQLLNSNAAESKVDKFLDDVDGGRPIENLTGTIRDMFDPINRDWFVVHKEWKKNLTLPLALGRTNNITSLYSAQTSNGMNSYWNFEYTLQFKGGKKLKFDVGPGSGGGTCQNFPYVMAIWRKSYSNIAPLSVKTLSFFDYTSQLFYTDA